MLSMIFSLNTLWWVLLPLYVICCLGLIVIVLLQKGKGVGFAGAFGAGPGGDAVFGPRSSKSLPQKITYTMAGIFMLIALVMSMLSGTRGTGAAPAIVEDTGVVPVSSSPMGTMDALFSDKPVSTPEAPTAPVEDASGTAAPATEAAMPVEEAAPAAEAPAAEAPATETPAAEAPAAEVPAAAEAPAAEAPAAETPAAETPAAEAPAPEAPAAQ